MFTTSTAFSVALNLDGALGIAIVDLTTGRCLARADNRSIDMEIAAAGNTEVLRAKLRLMRDLHLQDEIEDILITLGTQYHVLRPMKGKGAAGLFVYMVLDKSKANLALTRRKVAEIEQQIVLSAEEIASRTDSRIAEIAVEEPSADNSEEDNLPPFMRESHVLRILGLE